MKSVSVHEAKTHLSRILLEVHAGNEVVITKSGKPYAKICPLEPKGKRRPGLLVGKVDETFFDPLPEQELEAWES